MQQSLVAGELYHATLGCQVAAKDGQPTGRFQRLREQSDDLLSGRFSGGLRHLGDGPAVDSGRIPVDQPPLSQSLEDQRNAAGIVQVFRDILAAGLEAGDHRCPRRHPVEVVDGQRYTGFARNCQEMQDAVC